MLNGVQLYSIRVPGQTGQLTLDPTQAMLISIVLIVGTVNAINFVDGLDGLAGGMVCIGACAFFVFSYRLADVNNQTLAITGALLCACLAGACVGFLPHNFYPARIFMGDSGSMLLGLVLSGSALTLTGQFAGVQVTGTGAGTSPPRWPSCCRSCCRSRSWWCRSSTWCWLWSGVPGAARCSTSRTRSTCTTGCSRSATASAVPC